MVKKAYIELNVSALQMNIQILFKDDAGKHQVKDYINTLEKINVGQEKETRLKCKQLNGAVPNWHMGLNMLAGPSPSGF